MPGKPSMTPPQTACVEDSQALTQVSEEVLRYLEKSLRRGK